MKKDINNSMPAHPCGEQFIQHGNSSRTGECVGLTKLEAFTMAAMQGFIANPKYSESSDETVSACAVSLAKATLEALEKAK